MAVLRRQLLHLVLDLKQKRNPLFAGILCIVLYLAAMMSVADGFKTMMLLFSLLPTAILALGGKRYGIAAGFLISSINTLFLHRLTAADPELFYKSVLINGLVQILLGTGIGHLRDIQKQMERIVKQKQHALSRVRYMALHDSLTGLANHQLFNEVLDLALRHAQRDEKHLAVLFIDIDDFKLINATLGYPEGDALLRLVSNTIVASLRISDTVARFGGDEFVAVLPGFDSLDAIHTVTNRILKSVHAASSTVRMSVSGGIAMYPQDGHTPEDLIRNANEAMMVAKQNGKDRFCHWNEIRHESVRYGIAVESALRKALLNNEFRLCYHPILNISEGNPLGAEVLIRWTSSELGDVSPAVFIPIAERSGIIRDIGMWVLEQVLRDMKTMNEDGVDIDFLAINVSTAQLIDPGFPDKAFEKITAAGIDPAKLEFEVTETGIALQGNPAALLAPIKEIGVRVALDDFGTGNSSLRYLSELPIDVLKIDGSFVRKSMYDSKAAVITHSIVSLALMLDLNIVAECIENEEQRQTLYYMGADRMQGYLFRPPMPFAEFLDLLKQGASLHPIDSPVTKEPGLRGA